MEGLAELSKKFIPFQGFFTQKNKQFKSNLGLYHSVSGHHLSRGFYEIKLLLRSYEVSKNGRFLAWLCDLLS